nr:MAG TPA: integrase [Caudoviricetes sp.]
MGRANIRETMRYAHFAPEHLEYAVLINPFVNI